MIIEKLQEMEERIDRIEADMASPDVISRMEEYKKLAREHAELRDVVALFREWKKVKEELEKTNDLVLKETDPEMRELAREEADRLTQEDEREFGRSRVKFYRRRA